MIIFLKKKGHNPLYPSCQPYFGEGYERFWTGILYRKFKFRPTKSEVCLIEIEHSLYEYDTLYMEKDL